MNRIGCKLPFAKTERVEYKIDKISMEKLDKIEKLDKLKKMDKIEKLDKIESLDKIEKS